MTGRPNILILHADQHRWDCTGYTGNRRVRTPHLDELARDSVCFDQSFCPYAVCTPSRYSALSGLYVHQHAGWTNECTLAPGIATFPKLLRQAGYRTAAVGKMHFTPTYLDVGFERMTLAEQVGAGRLDCDYHRQLRAEGLLDADDLVDQCGEFRAKAKRSYWETFGASPSSLPEPWHSTTWIGERALEELGRWPEGDNLLMVGFIKPHHPFDPPERWARMYDPEQTELLPGWTADVPAADAHTWSHFPNETLSEAALRRITAYYYANISHIDHQIGRIVGLLKERGLYDQTLIIYTSDHGEYLGFHHMLGKSLHLYDPLVRVPLLIKFPGQDMAGSRRQTLVNNIDLAPTILGQAGLEPSPGMSGLNLADPQSDRDYVFAADWCGKGYLARSRTRKLLWNRTGADFFFDKSTEFEKIMDVVKHLTQTHSYVSH